MSQILEWGKPPKKMSKEEWKSIVADGAPPGVYTPNMDDEWQQKWKAKFRNKTKDNPGVEVRKTTDQGATQMLLVVYEDHVTLGMNGTAILNDDELAMFQQAVFEARVALYKLRQEREA